MESMKMFRVSQVIDLFKDLSKIPPDVLEEKRNVGTNVHTCIKAHIDNFPLFPVGREIGYFESFKNWFEEKKPEVKINEVRMYGKEQYENLSGQIDAVIQVKEKLFLVDYKTSASPDHLCWALQGYFYVQLLRQNGIDVSSNVCFIQLSANGLLPKLYWYDTEDKQIQDLAESAWTVFKARNKLIKFKPVRAHE